MARSEIQDQFRHDPVRIYVAAGEDIHCSGTVLRPSVDRKMGGGEEGEVSEAVGFELMAGGADDLRPTLRQHVTDKYRKRVKVFESFDFPAVVEIQKNMMPHVRPVKSSQRSRSPQSKGRSLNTD